MQFYFRADFEKSYGIFRMHGAKFEINGVYNIDGRILILPIKGSGKLNIKLEEVDFKFITNYEIYQKDNIPWSKPLNSTLEWDAEKTVYQLDNLFNGDEALGKRNIF